MKKDPVCGMEVEPESDAARLEHEGTTYYFCSEHCQAAFQREPERYVGKAAGSESEASGG